MGIVLGSAIQGAGATRETLLIDAFIVFVVQIPASLLVVFGLGRGPERLFQIVALTYVTYAVAYVVRYRGGAFLKTEVAG
jgi:Na+-driven multidrug efflux pump